MQSATETFSIIGINFILKDYKTSSIYLRGVTSKYVSMISTAFLHTCLLLVRIWIVDAHVIASESHICDAIKQNDSEVESNENLVSNFNMSHI